MELAVEAVAVVFVLGLFGFMFFMMWKDPEWWPRLSARLFFLPFSMSGRRALGEMFPSFGYSYFGTTGDAARDAKLRRRIRLSSRAFVVLSLGGVLFMFLFTIAMDVFS